MLGSGHSIVSHEVLDRLMHDECIRRRITITYISAWCDLSKYIAFCTPLLRPGYHGMQDVIIEDDGTIWFQRDRDV